MRRLDFFRARQVGYGPTHLKDAGVGAGAEIQLAIGGPGLTLPSLSGGGLIERFSPPGEKGRDKSMFVGRLRGQRG